MGNKSSRQFCLRSFRNREVPSLARVLMNAHGHLFWLGVLFRIPATLITFANPLLLRYLTLYINDPRGSASDPLLILTRELLNWMQADDTYKWKGVCFSFAMFFSGVAFVFFIQRHFYYSFLFGLQMKSAVTAAVYRKVLISGI